MRHRFSIAAALAAGLALSSPPASADAPSSPDAALAGLDAAAAGGPVLVIVRGQAFPSGRTRATLYRILQDPPPGRDVTYTFTKGKAADPSYRLSFVFNPPDGRPRGDRLCRGLVPGGAGDGTGFRVAFCRDGEPLNLVTGNAAGAVPPRGAAFRRLIERAMTELFHGEPAPTAAGPVASADGRANG